MGFQNIDTDLSMLQNSLTGTYLYVIGQQLLHNSLLANHIGEITGAKCFTLNSFSEIQFKSGFSNQDAFILWDANSLTLDYFRTNLQKARLPDSIRIVIFNAYEGFAVEKLIMHGVSGVFYEDQSPDLLIRGLLAVKHGDLWFPREILNTYILASQQNQRGEKTNPGSDLTNREFEILMSIAAGNTNNVIACELNISPHTVKTHVSNILRKINVPNRTAAATWARQQMELVHA